MDKDFEKWHKEKSDLHTNKDRPLFHERDVWFTSVGVNVGFEQDGKDSKFLRPVVIVKKFNNEIFWGIPTTKNNKEGKYYFLFSYREGASTTAILSQMKLMDGKRLEYHIGTMNEKDFLEMKKRLITFLK